MAKTDIALERGLPQNAEAEKFVLGALLTGEDYGLVNGSLGADDFSTEKHRRCFLRMGEIHDRGERLDCVTVANELIKHKQLESAGGVTYLSELVDLPAIANLEGWVRIVQEKSTLRRGVLACESMMERFLLASESSGELLVDAERVIRELAGRTVSAGNLQSVSQVIDDLDVNSIGKVPDSVIKTPYAGLNKRIVGMFPGELHVIGARPSAGKSVEAVETALTAAEGGKVVALFSLEMRKRAILMRAASNRAQVDNSNVRHGTMSEVERYDFMQALGRIKKLPLFIDDKAHTFADMASQVRKMKQKPHLMIVDHLHLMRSVGRHENRNNELAGITRGLKLFAGEMNVTVLLLAQLSRASEKENRPPEMRDLRDCGSIEADADVILLLHRKEAMTSADNKKPAAVTMLLAKQRDGVSMIKIHMLLMGKYFRLVEESEDQGTTEEKA